MSDLLRSKLDQIGARRKEGRNSCVAHADRGYVQTKTLSASTLAGVGRPAGARQFAVQTRDDGLMHPSGRWEGALVRSCDNPPGLVFALGRGLPLSIQRWWVRVAHSGRLGVWRGNKGGKLFEGLRDGLSWVPKTSYHTAW